MFDGSNEVEDKDNQEKQQFWKNHVALWEQSGIRQSEYCCRKPAADLTFVPVSVKPSQSTGAKPMATLRLIVRGGSCIETGDGFNQDTLRRVLDTVGWTP